MAEVRHAVARQDLLGNAAGSELLSLELHHIQVRGDLGQDVEVHIYIRGGKVFDRGEALAVLSAGLDLVDEFLRNHFTRLVVLCIDLQHLGFEGPVLVDLGRQLHEVAFGARDAAVMDVAEEGVEGVSELVEHGLYVVEGLERRLVTGREGHVADVGHDGLHALCAVVGLAAEAAAPGTGTLAVTREVIAVEDGNHIAVAVDHVPGLCGRLVLGIIFGALVERQAVELVRHIEDTLLHLVDFQILRHDRLIDVELGFLGFVEVVHIVPGLRFALDAVFLHHGLDVGDLFVRLLDGRRPDLVEQVVHVGGVLSHAVFERHGCIVAVAHQFGALQTQRDDAGGDGLVVVLVAVVAAVVVHLINLLAEVTVLAVLQHGIAAGALHVESIFALLADALGKCSRAVDIVLGKAFELLHGVDDHVGVVGVVHQVLAELQLEGRELHVDLGDLGLGVGIEQGAAIHIAVVGLLQQAFLLLVEIVFVLVVIDILDLFEQFPVHPHLIAVGGSQRVHLTGESLEFRRGAGAVERAPDRAGLGHQFAALFECHDHVFEAGFLGVVDDGLNLLLVLFHALEHAFAEVVDGQDFERRNLVGRLVAFLQERVLRIGRAPDEQGERCNKHQFFHMTIVNRMMILFFPGVAGDQSYKDSKKKRFFRQAEQFWRIIATFVLL